MAIHKINSNLKKLFLLTAILAISSIVFLIGKIFSHKNSNSLVAQIDLINAVNADYPYEGGDAGCCGSGASESSGGSY